MPLNGPFTVGCLIKLNPRSQDGGLFQGLYRVQAVTEVDGNTRLTVEGAFGLVTFDAETERAVLWTKPHPLQLVLDEVDNPTLDHYSCLPVKEQKRRDHERQRALFSGNPIPTRAQLFSNLVDTVKKGEYSIVSAPEPGEGAPPYGLEHTIVERQTRKILARNEERARFLVADLRQRMRAFVSDPKSNADHVYAIREVIGPGDEGVDEQIIQLAQRLGWRPHVQKYIGWDPNVASDEIVVRELRPFAKPSPIDPSCMKSDDRKWETPFGVLTREDLVPYDGQPLIALPAQIRAQFTWLQEQGVWAR